MLSKIILLAAAATTAVAQSAAYGQCGGQGWTGSKSCVSGYTCQVSNAYYSQCLPSSQGTIEESPRRDLSCTDVGCV